MSCFWLCCVVGEGEKTAASVSGFGVFDKHNGCCMRVTFFVSQQFMVYYRFLYDNGRSTVTCDIWVPCLIEIFSLIYTYAFLFLILIYVLNINWVSYIWRTRILFKLRKTSNSRFLVGDHWNSIRLFLTN